MEAPEIYKMFPQGYTQVVKIAVVKRFFESLTAFKFYRELSLWESTPKLGKAVGDIAAFDQCFCKSPLTYTPISEPNKLNDLLGYIWLVLLIHPESLVYLGWIFPLIKTMYHHLI